MKFVLPLLLVFGTFGPAHAGTVNCKTMSGAGELMPDIFNYVVVGTERLYFHTVPDSKCREEGVFVIPGDKLQAEVEYGPHGEWTLAKFTTKKGKEVIGWVRTDRLQFVEASGINLEDDKVEGYLKAAAAAKAGRLGSPIVR